jgi:hypothetical protein
LLGVHVAELAAVDGGPELAALVALHVGDVAGHIDARLLGPLPKAIYWPVLRLVPLLLPLFPAVSQI